MAIIIVGTCLLGVLPIFYIKYYGTEMQQGILWVESVILMFVWFVLIWAILIFSIYFCTESSIYEAMYIFALSYGVEHIFYCIRVLVEHFTGGIIGNKHPLVYIPCLAGSFLLAYFWFTTCNPCVGELSELDALNKELAEKGGSLIGVNTFTLDAVLR